MSQIGLESFVKLRFLSFQICLSVNQRTVFWRLKMYLQFAPKMNDICVVKSIFLLHLSIIVNLVIYSMKVIVGKRELLVPIDLSSPVLKHLQTSNIFQAAKRKVFTRTPFCPLLLNTCLEERSHNLGILQRRGHFVSAVSPVLIFLTFYTFSESYVNTRLTL